MRDSPDFDLEADCYRRRITCRAVTPERVVADLEDDFHHFRVTLAHDGTSVSGVECESVRWPWATCPEAAHNLQPLVGMPLSDRFTAAASVAEPRENCTHQFDCAAHAIVHASRGTPVRVYDVEVPLRDEAGRTTARLWVDGRAALTWHIAGSHTVDPLPPFDRAPRHGFMAWADRELDAEAAEAAIVLRRGSTIGMGRGWPFDDFDDAAQITIGGSGVCYTMTPGRASGAVRMRGMIRDFAAHPENLGTERTSG